MERMNWRAATTCAKIYLWAVGSAITARSGSRTGGARLLDDDRGCTDTGSASGAARCVVREALRLMTAKTIATYRSEPSPPAPHARHLGAH
jgi:hypothetical protein